MCATMLRVLVTGGGVVVVVVVTRRDRPKATPIQPLGYVRFALCGYPARTYYPTQERKNQIPNSLD